MQKIGIFGGAFNPVHNGHLALANHFLKALNLDKVIFIPTANPPHRNKDEFVSFDDRMNMLSLATKENASFEVSDIEFKRTSKSYTYDTIIELKKIYKNDKLYLLIGADQYFNFKNWYKPEEILNEVTLCTGARNDELEYQKMLSFKESESIYKNSDVIIFSYDIISVSSNEIREKIKNGKSVNNFLPKNVCEYIIKKGLYNV